MSPSLASQVDTLRADFSLPADGTIPSVVQLVSSAVGLDVKDKPMAEQVKILYESIHGATTTSSGEGEGDPAVPIAMGVLVGSSEAVPADALPVLDPQSSAVMTGTTTLTVSKSISDAIQLGAPAYNNGDAAGCYYIYKRTGEEIVARRNGSSHSRIREGFICALLQAALEADGAGGMRRAAWTMRRTMDEFRTSSAALPRMPTARQLWEAVQGEDGLAAKECERCRAETRRWCHAAGA